MNLSMIETRLGNLFKNSREAGKKGLPVLSVTMNSGIVNRETLSRKMAPDLPPEKSLLVRSGDIVYNMMRMWQGAVAVVKQDGLVSPAYVVCRPNGDIDSQFAYYFLKTPAMLHKLKSYSYGITGDRLRLYYKDFAAIPVQIPPLETQKLISGLISTWDEAINQTRKLIFQKKDQKKALMQQLLMGKSRLPGFMKKKGREAHRFFDLPIDWACPSLREIAKERSERNKGNGKATVLSCSKHKGFVESSQYFGKKVFSEDTSNYKIIRRGWFGYPSNHIEEGSIGLVSEHDAGIVSPIYTVFECSEKVVPEYLYAVFKTETFRHIFSISTNSSVDRRGSLRWREFSLIRVPLPGIDEQQAISNVLAEADREIADMERQLKFIEKQKRGLMQKLLTGEVRVKP